MTKEQEKYFAPKVISPRVVLKVVDLVCKHFKITEAELKGTSKAGNIIKARLCAYWLLYTYGPQSLTCAARPLNRTHGSAFRGVKVVNNSIETQTYLNKDIAVMRRQMNHWLCNPWQKSNKTLRKYTMKSLLEQKVNKHLTAA